MDDDEKYYELQTRIDEALREMVALTSPEETWSFVAQIEQRMRAELDEMEKPPPSPLQ